MDYAIEDKKSTYLGPKLARIYIEGKKVPQNLERAVEILSVSTLIKAKWMLMKLAIDNECYTDAYHYAEYLSNSKWRWETQRDVKRRISDVRTRNYTFLKKSAKHNQIDNKALLIIEQKYDLKWYR